MSDYAPGADVRYWPGFRPGRSLRGTVRSPGLLRREDPCNTFGVDVVWLVDAESQGTQVVSLDHVKPWADEDPDDRVPHHDHEHVLPPRPVAMGMGQVLVGEDDLRYALGVIEDEFGGSNVTHPDEIRRLLTALGGAVDAARTARCGAEQTAQRDHTCTCGRRPDHAENAHRCVICSAMWRVWPGPGER